MRPTALLPAAVLVIAVSACGGSGKGTAAPTPTTTGPANLAAATADVSKAWSDFFDGSLPAAQRAAVLEGAAGLGQALTLSGRDPNATFTTAKVTSVSFPDPTHAAVKYDLSVHGTSAL